MIGELSGGERNRVHLAKVLKSGGNVLLLDEPTNDLDIETLRALEEALLSFPGCAVVISHDRWFLDRIATHILAFEGDSQVVWFEGNYQEYVEDYKRRKGEEAAQPHRIKLQAAHALSGLNRWQSVSDTRGALPGEPKDRSGSALGGAARGAAGVRGGRLASCTARWRSCTSAGVFAHLHAIPRRTSSRRWASPPRATGC